MSKQKYCIIPSLEVEQTYGLILNYLSSLPLGLAKEKFLRAISAFWKAPAKWEVTQEGIGTTITAQNCILEIELQKAKISEDFAIEPTEKRSVAIIQPLRVTSRQKIEFRFQPKETTPTGEILDYLNRNPVLLSAETRYWYPCAAYWSVYAAKALGYEEESVEKMARYCLSKLKFQKNFLEKTYVQLLTKGESIKNPIDVSTKLSSENQSEPKKSGLDKEQRASLLLNRENNPNYDDIEFDFN